MVLKLLLCVLSPIGALVRVVGAGFAPADHLSPADCTRTGTPGHHLPGMRDEASSVALQDTPGRLTGLENPHKGLRPFPRRKVIKLKPLQEATRSPVQACHTHQLAVRADSDCVSTSPLSFSPTSVLPQQRDQGAGNLFKALKLQADKAAASAAGVDLHAVKQQQLGSWADKQVIHNLSNHVPALPLPGAVESEVSGPIVICHPMKLQQPHVPAIKKGSTLDAAWRWRSMRLWAKEQLKHLFPEQQYNDDEEEAGSDPWHDALHMIQAANTSPDAGVPICDHDCYAQSSPSPLLDSGDLDGLLEDEATPVDRAGTEGPEMIRSSSSRALAEAASKARELLKYQVCILHSSDSKFTYFVLTSIDTVCLSKTQSMHGAQQHVCSCIATA